MNLVIIETDNNSRTKTERLKSSKGLLKIKGEYLIERIIRIGQANGITRVFCIINSHEPELEHYLSTNNFGIAIQFIVPELRSPMHILFALTSTHNKEPFILVNSNSVFLESEFSEFVTYSLLQADAAGTIAVTRNLNDEKPVGVAMNDADIILKFNNSKEGYSWFNGGIYYFSPQILIETNYAFQSGITGIEKFLQFLIEKEYVLKGFSFSRIIKVENIADIAKAEDLIRGIEY
jgi:NDP-sugar pyrophosphorylase family protein